MIANITFTTSDMELAQKLTWLSQLDPDAQLHLLKMYERLYSLAREIND